MQIPPAAVLLSWPTANYENPITHGQALIVTNVVFMAFMVLAIILRYYTRLQMHKSLGWDDIYIGISLIFALALGAVVILANVRYDWDRHIWDIPISQYKNASLVAFVAKLAFTFAATFTRLSLLCFYFRLVLDSGHKKFIWLLWFSVAWQIAVCATFTFQVVFLCDPIDAYWDVAKALTGKCLNEGTSTLAAGIINCISDLWITILPVPIIWKLKMPVRQRVGVVVLLSIGIIVTIAGIVRTFYIWKSLVDTWDETWYSYPLWICAAVEIDLAVLCACAPALKPLFHPLISTVRFYTTSSGTKRDTTSSALSKRGQEGFRSDGSSTLPGGGTIAKDGTMTKAVTRSTSHASSRIHILEEGYESGDLSPETSKDGTLNALPQLQLQEQQYHQNQGQQKQQQQQQQRSHRHAPRSSSFGWIGWRGDAGTTSLGQEIELTGGPQRQNGGSGIRNTTRPGSNEMGGDDRYYYEEDDDDIEGQRHQRYGSVIDAAYSGQGIEVQKRFHVKSAPR